MSTISIQWQSEAQRDKDELISLLGVFGDLLPRSLRSGHDLDVYAGKLLAHADLAYAVIKGNIVGLLALYANDQGSRRAFIPFMSILPDHQRRGIGKVMLARALALARARRMQVLDLEVNRQNQPAQRLYEAIGFRPIDTEGDHWKMRYDFAALSSRSQATPIEKHPRLLSTLGLDIDLRVKRDDLYPMAGGGIKARKIEYIMRDLISEGHDVLVTNGGPQSNHARASAVLCAQLGIACHLVVVLEPGQKYMESGNVLLMRMSGATMEFCRKDQLAERMDRAIEHYQHKGHRPLYVWGGGHCTAGTLAFVDAAEEAQSQCGAWEPDYLVAASATGTTQAGFAIGYAGTRTRVIGISVARDSVRGGEIVHQSIEEYVSRFKDIDLAPADIDVDFRDDWTEGGYEKTSPGLLRLIERAAAAGILVDPTYSGKALHGLVEMTRRGEIPRGSKVLFWHTGGLMNLQASPFAGGVVSL